MASQRIFVKLEVAEVTTRGRAKPSGDFIHVLASAISAIESIKGSEAILIHIGGTLSQTVIGPSAEELIDEISDDVVAWDTDGDGDGEEDEDEDEDDGDK